MAGPTEQEKCLIKQFRSQVSDLNLEDDSDMQLIRWIRCREHNLSKAEDMLRKHRKFNMEHDIDNILDWEPPEYIADNYPVDIIGKDDENCPVGVLAYGKWDVKKAYELGYREEYLRYLGKILQMTIDSAKSEFRPDGVPVTQFVLILDMEGLSMKFLTSLGAMDLTLETLRIFEANHPERLKKCYVINASRIFTLLFAVVKPVLSVHTFGKVSIFDSNASKWMPLLQLHISNDILPAKFGGNNYTSIINGYQKRLQARRQSEGCTTVMVAAGGKYPIQYEVTQCKTVLSWFFLTVKHDIGFSLSCDNEEVVKYSRVESKLRPIEGSFICERPGNYTFLLDNSYSRMRAKGVKYRIGMECPEEEDDGEYYEA